MSGVAGLYNVPGTDSELATWSFVHAAHHRDIIRVVYQTKNIAMPEYSLDPFNPRQDMGVWLYQHQEMHDNFDQVLGISGFDLTDVNWQDREQLAAWILLNASEHYQAANTLEIG